MPATAWGWEIAPDELESWVLQRSTDLVVLNKPAGVICHPSRHGPWSSLVGAVRAWLGAVTPIHMPSRLDRETSGVLVMALNEELGRRLHRTVQCGMFEKTYTAVLEGTLQERVTVDQPIGRDTNSEFYSRQTVLLDGGQSACTDFEPLAFGGGHTLVRVQPRTGRRHQIRVHASWLGHPVAGDKLYGPDRDLMLRLIATDFRDADALPVRRHMLHASEVAFGSEGRFSAPLTNDMSKFWAECSGELPQC